MESAPGPTLACSPRTPGCISSSPKDLSMFRLLRWPWTWFSPTTKSTLFPHLEVQGRGKCGNHDCSKNWAKKKVKCQPNPISSLYVNYPWSIGGGGAHLFKFSFSNQYTSGSYFFFQIACHIQLQLCLSSPDPTPISPTTIPIFSPMDTYSCFQCQFISFLHSSQTRRVLLSFFGLLPDFLHVRIKEFLCFKEKMLKELPALFSPAPLSPRAVSFQEFWSSNAFNKWHCALLEPSLYYFIHLDHIPRNDKLKYTKDFFYCSASYGYSTSLLSW